eukprot:1609650-Amphidinium_carterae.1
MLSRNVLKHMTFVGKGCYEVAKLDTKHKRYLLPPLQNDTLVQRTAAQFAAAEFVGRLKKRTLCTGSSKRSVLQWCKRGLWLG